ncbi:MAG TPA: hypothetical protein VFS98_02515, partial [Methylomirabilota bacterium]|nr:hypothetical protein [Methylomirabilota bacterium]
MPLREWHTDNGAEFLNHGLVEYCRRHGIHFTRGRDYRKNDQAWVELRNWLIVRRRVGRDRYSSRAAYQRLRRLYELVRVQVNFFRTFRKLLAGRRVGSKRVRRYDAAQRPTRGASPPAGSPTGRATRSRSSSSPWIPPAWRSRS